jgi:hypothetical protein
MDSLPKKAKEATILLKQRSTLLAKKWETHSEVCGYVNARMSIAIVRATHLCLHGCRIPTIKMDASRRGKKKSRTGHMHIYLLSCGCLFEKQ